MLRLIKFNGVMRKSNPYSRDLSVADVAINMDMTGGSLRSFRAPVKRADVTPGAHVNILGCDVISFPSGTTASAIYSTSTKEVVFAQGGKLYIGYGAGGTVIGQRPLGVEPPATPPTVIAQNSTEEKSMWRVYAYTIVSPVGEESSPSPASPQVRVLDGTAVTVHMSQQAPEGYTIRLYRTATAVRSQEEALGLKTGMLLVAELPGDTKMFVDQIKTVDLGRGLDTVDDGVPPIGVTHVIKVGDSAPVLCAAVGHQLVFSRPHRPNAWPYREELSLRGTVVSLTAGGGKIYAVTTVGTYLIDAVAQDGFRNVIHLLHAPPPLSMHQDAIVYTPMGAVYAATEGLYLIAPTGEVVSVTAPIMTPHAYRTTFVGNVALGYSRGVLYASMAEKAYCITMGEGTDKLETTGLVEVPPNLARQYLTTNTGQLYAVTGSVVNQWDAGSFLEATWETTIMEYMGAITAARAAMTPDTKAWLTVIAEPSGDTVEKELGHGTVRLRPVQRSSIKKVRIRVIGDLYSLGLGAVSRDLKGGK